jgi:signal transduction histidine kinase
MLLHSRANPGQKELVDINSVADEYLRLAYHGFRARNKDFLCKIHTKFDDSIGMIQTVSQDLGRVLMNIYNNAFYAVSEKRKVLGDTFQPLIEVTIKKITGSSGGEMISIVVEDNGIGIPEKFIDKVFQPFFTTKPAGQGTGLGLSLAYDTIKASGGEMRVASKEGEKTEFMIELPI